MPDFFTRFDRSDAARSKKSVNPDSKPDSDLAPLAEPRLGRSLPSKSEQAANSRAPEEQSFYRKLEEQTAPRRAQSRPAAVEARESEAPRRGERLRTEQARSENLSTGVQGQRAEARLNEFENSRETDLENDQFAVEPTTGFSRRSADAVEETDAPQTERTAKGFSKAPLKAKSAKEASQSAGRSAGQGVGQNITQSPEMQLLAMSGGANAGLNGSALNGMPMKTDEGDILALKEAYLDQQAQIRQAAVGDFMGRLQEQYGIGTDQVVQAFAGMDQETLMGPPEGATTQFLDNLGLKGQVRKDVAGLYRQMVQTTGESELKAKLVQTEGDKVDLELMNTAEVQMQKLNDSLDELNRTFFRKGQPGGQSQKDFAAIQSQIKPNTDKDSDDSVVIDRKAAAGGGLAAGRYGQSAQGLAAAQSAAGAAANSSAAGASAPTPMTQASHASAFSEMAARFSGSGGGNAGQDSMSDGDSDTSDLTSQQALNAQANAAAGNPDAKAFAQKLNSESTSDALKGKKASLTEATTKIDMPDAKAGMVGATTAQKGSTAATVAAGAAFSATPGASRDDEAQNIQQVIKQAQTFIRKGGGEMNMELKPEGMGQVNLKVMVQNGIVNIQMVTQNDKAKKLLEEGLTELKANLAAHKLQVDTLKIATAEGAMIDKRSEHGSDAQREAMRDAQREFASGFMGNMRDDNQGMRQGFGEMPGWRAYRREPNRVSLETPTSSAAEQKSEIHRRDVNRRLNLVA